MTIEEGQYYYMTRGSIFKWIMEVLEIEPKNRCRANIISLHSKKYNPRQKGTSSDVERKATTEEIEWLNQCKTARTYVDYKPNPDDYSLF